MAHFKAAWAADSLNGLKRFNGAGELPRSMVREAPGRRRRPGSWLQSASTRPLCEYGSCQTCVTRNPYCHSKTIRFVKFAAIAVLFAEYLLAYAIVILVHKSRTLAAPAPGYAGACLLKERPSWGWATRRSHDLHTCRSPVVLVLVSAPIGAASSQHVHAHVACTVCPLLVPIASRAALSEAR